jgi:hypothetical protein
MLHKFTGRYRANGKLRKRSRASDDDSLLTAVRMGHLVLRVLTIEVRPPERIKSVYFLRKY